MERGVGGWSGLDLVFDEAIVRKRGDDYVGWVFCWL